MDMDQGLHTCPMKPFTLTDVGLPTIYSYISVTLPLERR